MIPWLGFGHMLVFMKLAKLIAKKGHKISFISTPRNIDRLPKLAPDLAPLIDLVKIPLPSIPNLPEDAEATSDLPFNKVKYLKIAFDRLQQPITEFLEAKLPNWIFIDYGCHWLIPVASKLNIRVCLYSVFPGCCMGFLGPPSVLIKGDYRIKPEDFTVKPDWVPFQTNVAMSYFQIAGMAPNFEDGDESENVSDLYRIGVTTRDCNMVAIRSCWELEPEWLKLLDQIMGKPIVQVGLLPTPVTDFNDPTVDDESWGDIKKWLDRQEKGSVVYISFGSESKPTQTQLTELALGVELSGLPFFWAIKKQRGLADTEVTELPQGFEDRTRGRGMVYTSWVPQDKILSHDSLGGLLFQSGWSSVVEAVQFGKQLVLLPLVGDQELIARMLEEKKMGFMIPRNERDGWFGRDTVADSLKLVMVDEEGKIYRDKIKEMQSVFADMDKQDRYVDNLLAYLQTH